MTQRRPFITDPRLLKMLDGQAYVALRPSAEISAVFHEVQSRFRAVLPAFVTYPAEPHVTLRGFPAGTDRAVLQDVVGTWSRSVPTVELEIEDVSAFHAPYKIPIFQIRRTPALSVAFADLVSSTQAANLPEFSSAPSPAEWIFHLSIAYCKAVDEATWTTVNSLIASLRQIRGRCVVDQVELVTYDGAVERLTAIYHLLGIGSGARRGTA